MARNYRKDHTFLGLGLLLFSHMKHLKEIAHLFFGRGDIRSRRSNEGLTLTMVVVVVTKVDCPDFCIRELSLQTWMGPLAWLLSATSRFPEVHSSQDAIHNSRCM